MSAQSIQRWLAVALEETRDGYGNPTDEFGLGIKHGFNHAIDLIQRADVWSRSVAASTAEFDSADAGSSPAATAQIKRMQDFLCEKGLFGAYSDWVMENPAGIPDEFSKTEGYRIDGRASGPVSRAVFFIGKPKKT